MATIKSPEGASVISGLSTNSPMLSSQKKRADVPSLSPVTASSIGTAALEGNNRHQRGEKRGGKPVSRNEFGCAVDACLLPYSVAWADAMYEACLGEADVAENSDETHNGEGGKKRRRKIVRTQEEFWAAFGEALESALDDCDDILCR